jgi:hypothetical protein
MLSISHSRQKEENGIKTMPLPSLREPFLKSFVSLNSEREIAAFVEKSQRWSGTP